MIVGTTNQFKAFDEVLIGELLFLTVHLQVARALAKLVLQLGLLFLHELGGDHALCLQLRYAVLVLVKKVLHLLLVDLGKQNE